MNSFPHFYCGLETLVYTMVWEEKHIFLFYKSINVFTEAEIVLSYQKVLFSYLLLLLFQILLAV